MSDWKEDANKRRDKRNTKISDEPTQSLKLAKKKKDTKRWCGGKEGREHKKECRAYSDTKNADRKIFNGWRLLVCITCGKELDCYFPMGLMKRKKPEWVDK